jgi:hypothetical protein
MDGKRTRRCRKGDDNETIPGMCINKRGKKYKPNIWTNRGKYVYRPKRKSSRKISRKSKLRSRKSKLRSKKSKLRSKKPKIRSRKFY